MSKRGPKSEAKIEVSCSKCKWDGLRVSYHLHWPCPKCGHYYPRPLDGSDEKLKLSDTWGSTPSKRRARASIDERVFKRSKEAKDPGNSEFVLGLDVARSYNIEVVIPSHSEKPFIYVCAVKLPHVTRDYDEFGRPGFDLKYGLLQIDFAISEDGKSIEFFDQWFNDPTQKDIEFSQFDMLGNVLWSRHFKNTWIVRREPIRHDCENGNSARVRYHFKTDIPKMDFGA